MTASKTLEWTTIILMWLCLIFMLYIKAPSMMCLIMVIYSILASVLMSLGLKLTLIPFIALLTMAGSLIILFLYFTATATPPSKMTPSKTPSTPLVMASTAILITMLITGPQFANTMSPLKEVEDPATPVFTPMLSPLTLWMIILLGIMLAAIVHICSKKGSALRKFKTP